MTKYNIDELKDFNSPLFLKIKNNKENNKNVGVPKDFKVEIRPEDFDDYNPLTSKMFEQAHKDVVDVIHKNL